MKPLPPHLADMTQAKWEKLTRAQQHALRDTSELHPALVPYVGQKVRVSPKREHGLSTFRVGVSTGWRPCMMAMRAGSYGSSDVISPSEVFEHVTPL